MLLGGWRKTKIGKTVKKGDKMTERNELLQVYLKTEIEFLSSIPLFCFAQFALKEGVNFFF